MYLMCWLPLHHEAHSCGPDWALKLFIYLTETSVSESYQTLSTLAKHWM